MNKHEQSLELNKVLEKLSSFCRSADAREAAGELLPQSDYFDVKNLLDETQAAHTFIAKFGAPSFAGLTNVDNALSRAAAGAVLAPAELLKVAATLKAVREICTWHEKCAGMQTALDEYFAVLYPNKYLEEKITNAIISETEISDNASSELKKIRRDMRHYENKIRSQLDSMIHSSHYSKFLQDNIITQRNGRYVIPVKSESRNEVAGMVHDTSGSGATIFIEPAAVVEANNEIKVLESKEKDEIEKILAELSSESAQYADSIKQSYLNAVKIDLVFAKAHLAYEMKASMPLLNSDGEILLKQARHPLIDPKSVVPVDISLGSDFDSLIITGANTGGKTVSIKTIGLLVLMAECGLMLPVRDNSKVSVFERVLADIGDEQSIEQSLSTFSSHMTNVADILTQADGKSLVLIDELGAGTDPIEGAALAVAILENLQSKGAKVACTTHYSELKEYALKTDRVENGCCEFDIETLKPTYRLLLGMPGRSNALAIAKRLGIDDGIIDYARSIISDENTRFEDAVDSLESTRKRLDDEKAVIEDEKAAAVSEREKAEKLLEESRKKSEKEIERAKLEAERIVENARRAGNSLLLEIEKLKKEQAKTNNLSEIARKAKSAMRNQMDMMDEVAGSLENEEEYVLPRELKLGDRVKIHSLGSEGEITGIDEKKNAYIVQSGMMKVSVKKDDLRLLGEKKKPEKKRSYGAAGSSKASTVASSIDVRGETVEEATLDIDKYIDGVLRTGLNEFTIIHGKGTGALRKGIHAYLKGHPSIRSFRLGTFGEGEDGVTVCQL
ncbi:MAG: endonuclease MutS2, partial [Clostridiales bacterium]|nr:endonuclease MutS2 [Clostridiales bacterium]